MTSPPSPDPADHRRPTGAGGASGALGPEDRRALVEVLHRAQRLSFLGPGPVEPQLDHALRFAEAAGQPPDVALDLGSGGGLPGLVLAAWWGASRWVLLEASARRAQALEEAVAAQGWEDRVLVDGRRAEEAGRDPARRSSVDLVTARSFGAPAIVAECGAPFLRPGGRLVVSDPPEGPGRRWPAEGLALLGLEVAEHTAGCTVLRLVAAVDDRYPRRVGIPAKRPLF